LIALGHNASPAHGGIAGGYEGIMFTADPNAPQASGGPGRACQGPAAAHNRSCPAQPIKGFYRAGIQLPRRRARGRVLMSRFSA
jgi:hypothetical protein